MKKEICTKSWHKILIQSAPASIRSVSDNDFKRIIKRIIDIERNSFEYPWLYCDFYSVLHENGSCCYVVECDGLIIGYAVIKNYPDCVELYSIAVDEDHRKHKMASLMINMLKIKLQMERKKYIFLYVSEYNVAAQLFLRKMKFIATSVIRDCYMQGHGAYYMVFDLSEQI
jgi:ribosomal protein S18 acetylase RimI-like enzyme